MTGLPPGIKAGAPKAAATAQASAKPAAPKVDYLSKLKGSVIGKDEGKTPPPIIVVRGNKNAKTIAAVAVETDNTPGFPRPDGSKVVVVSFDNQTENSLRTHYAADAKFAAGEVEVIHIARDLGFDTSMPETAIGVCEGFLELLRHLRDEGKTGMLVLDRFDLYTEHILKVFCYAKADADIDGPLGDAKHWTPRNLQLNAAFDLAQQAVADGGCIVVTVPRDVNDGQEKLTNVNGRWVKAPVPSKALSRFEHIVSALIDSHCDVDATTGEKVHHAESAYSRVSWLPDGIKVSVEGRHAGAFLDAKAQLEAPPNVPLPGSA